MLSRMDELQRKLQTSELVVIDLSKRYSRLEQLQHTLKNVNTELEQQKDKLYSQIIFLNGAIQLKDTEMQRERDMFTANTRKVGAIIAQARLKAVCACCVSLRCCRVVWCGYTIVSDTIYPKHVHIPLPV